MRDVWSGAALLVVGLTALVEVRRLPLGSVASPGPGLFPFAMAAALVGVGVALVLRARATGPTHADAMPAPPEGLRRLVTVVIALFVYALILSWLGFALSTFLLMTVLLRTVQAPPWFLTLGGSAAIAVLAHLLFKTWLGVRLPPGPWGF